ncbi:MAG TPA: hypothetical protein DEB17_01705 [Chlorobaculum sp.]|uniref:Uncharacterized protein n=1 Tax=Chlorobaculum tepidum (strain ATCC 49652 / DSM 12025 / NBRC 103806 / TLS) TaxID=194439 RepID=Q8KDF2_CHLTE|nr:hypothetical protein CT1098 [Chlorobaculum tepidum TLS]HBU22714.1 hypothetical protein [Chlorobaculum sp.]
MFLAEKNIQQSGARPDVSGFGNTDSRHNNNKVLMKAHLSMLLKNLDNNNAFKLLQALQR